MNLDVRKIINQLRSKAHEVMKEPRSMEKLFQASKRKFNDADLSTFKELKQDFVIAQELFAAYVNGSYKSVPWQTLTAIVVAMIYFLNPFDMIPDFVPLTGLVDDATVFIYIFGSIRNDLDKFKDHKNQQQ